MGCVYMYIHIRNIIDNSVITFYGDRWLLDIVVIIFLCVSNAKSFCGTPETTIVLYVNYDTVQKKV